MTIEQRDKELNRILETFETHRLEIYRKLKDGSFAPDEAFDRVNSLRHETQQELVATTEQYAAKERQALLDELERIAYTDTGEFTLVELRRLIRASKRKDVKGSN